MFRASVLSLAVLAALCANANAQAVAPGNLLVSRTVYAGNATTVTAGQTLPGGGKAVANGTFPDVFKNEGPDAAFGVTAPAFASCTIADRPSKVFGLCGLAGVS